MRSYCPKADRETSLGVHKAAITSPSWHASQVTPIQRDASVAWFSLYRIPLSSFILEYERTWALGIRHNVRLRF